MSSTNNDHNCSLYLQLFMSQNISSLMVPFVCVRYSLEVELFLIVIFVVLFVGTAGGNFLVITSVTLVKKLQTPSNFLILNLACSDFLVSILVLPGAIYQQINRNRWPFSELLCDIFISCDVILCTSSILNLCAISIDRYLVITRPLQYAVKRTPKRIGTMIAISWLSSALISIPPMIGWKETFVPGQCSYSENLIYQIYATFGAFYIPLLVMLILYGRIFKLAREMALADNKLSVTYTSQSLAEKSSKDVDSKLINGQIDMTFDVGSVNSDSKDANNQVVATANKYRRAKSHTDSKAITTLGVIMGCFTISWLPFFLVQIAKSVLKVADIDYMLYLPLWLIELCLWLGYANSFLNPIIYVKFNREFRTPFKQILMCKCASVNARLRNETFAQEYGLSSVTAKMTNCGKRLSCDQSSLNNSIVSGNRRRRVPMMSRLNPHPSNGSNHTKVPCNHITPTYNCTPISPVSHTSSDQYDTLTDLGVHTQCDHSDIDQSLPSCPIFDQRSEKYAYDFGPSWETCSIDSPAIVDTTTNT